MRERLITAGLEPVYYGPDGMRDYIANQRRGFASAIRTANIRIDS